MSANLERIATNALILRVGSLVNLTRDIDELALHSDCDRSVYVLANAAREIVARLAQLVIHEATT